MTAQFICHPPKQSTLVTSCSPASAYAFAEEGRRSGFLSYHLKIQKKTINACVAKLYIVSWIIGEFNCIICKLHDLSVDNFSTSYF